MSLQQFLPDVNLRFKEILSQNYNHENELKIETK